MKHLLSVLLLACTGLTAAAQREQDFASRYMSLYGEGTGLQCATVSPLMMERILQLPESRDSEHVREVLSQLKSIRVVSDKAADEGEALYDKAVELVKDNPRRYKPYAETDGQSIYLRKRGGIIVELVLLTYSDEGVFNIVNLTGNMSDAFLRELLNI